MTNKVKPFYIRITDDMTPQMVQDAFDKCVDAGAVARESVMNAKPKHAYKLRYNLGFSFFGIDDQLATYFDDDLEFFTNAQEITLDQLDEWLRLEVELEWKNGDDCVFDNRVKRDFDNPLLVYEYPNQRAIVHRAFKNKHKFDMVLIEFEDGYCAAVMQECISKPETPEQKAERERLEAAYDLYCEECKVMKCSQFTFNEFKDEHHLKARLLAIVDKTNYRKQ